MKVEMPHEDLALKRSGNMRFFMDWWIYIYIYIYVLLNYVYPKGTNILVHTSCKFSFARFSKQLRHHMHLKQTCHFLHRTSVPQTQPLSCMSDAPTRHLRPMIQEFIDKLVTTQVSNLVNMRKCWQGSHFWASKHDGVKTWKDSTATWHGRTKPSGVKNVVRRHDMDSISS